MNLTILETANCIHFNPLLLYVYVFTRLFDLLYLWFDTSDKHIFYNQSLIYYVLLKSKVSIKNKKSIFIVNADFILLIWYIPEVVVSTYDDVDMVHT
jgi:hypothetical protein